MRSRLLAQGATIGIFGGGQLGRMLSCAAQKLGYRIHIYDLAPDTPAGRTGQKQTCAEFEDLDSVREFASVCDVLTYEFENIPVGTVKVADEITPVFPKWNALETAQDRLVEKTFISGPAKSPVIGFRDVASLSQLCHATADLGFPAILKTRRLGYDGKGQIKLDHKTDLGKVFEKLGGQDLILEAFAPFVREISIIAARGKNEKIKFYPLTENVHKNHILHTSMAPAADRQNISRQAEEIVARILDSLDYVGVMGIEFFEMTDGSLVVNEIAPRVHNSGHWTMDAGCTDQFEQHIRAITGRTLGSTKSKYNVQMTNLIGDDIRQAPKLSKESDTFVHDYDKCDIRPGRKMGHVNRRF